MKAEFCVEPEATAAVPARDSAPLNAVLLMMSASVLVLPTENVVV